MIKFMNILRKRKNKKKYNIIDKFEKEPINNVISFSDLECIFNTEGTQLIIEHTVEKTIAYKFKVQNVTSTLAKRPTLNQKDYKYTVDIPELEKISEWTSLFDELNNVDTGFNSIYNIFKTINKYNSSKIFIFLPDYKVTNVNMKINKYCSDLEKHSRQTLTNPYFKFINLHSERELSLTNLTLRYISRINYGITPTITINYDNNYIHLAINIDNWENPFTFKINLNFNKVINYFKNNYRENSRKLKLQQEYFYDLNKIGDMIPKSLTNNHSTSVIIVNNKFLNLKSLLDFKGIKNIIALIRELTDILDNCTDLNKYCYALIAYNLFNNLTYKLGTNVKIIIHENLHGGSSDFISPAIIGYLIDYMNFDFKKQLC